MRLKTILLVALVAACDDPFAAEATREYQSIATGGEHTCAVATDGGAYCWGRGLDGELGNGINANQERPVRAKGDVAFRQITAGESHTCALATDGQVFCWGWDAFYQRGNPDNQQASEPVPVSSAIRFQSVSAGAHHTCALSVDSLAYCWGLNRFGQTGDGTTVIGIAPKAVQGGLKFARITGGGSHTCAITRLGAAYCWGSNQQGQLGIGSGELMVLSPTPVAGAIRFTTIDAGYTHTCGIAIGGQGYCWGSNEYGEIGNGTIFKQDLAAASTPNKTSAFMPAVTIIAAGTGNTCAVDTSRRSWCWGRGIYGQLANGSTDDQRHPQPLLVHPGGRNASDAFVVSEFALDGATHGCALADRAVFCWGTAAAGQLGTGQRFALQPQRVGD